MSPEVISYPSQSRVFTAQGVNFDRLVQTNLNYNVVKGDKIEFSDEKIGKIMSPTEIVFEIEDEPGEGESCVVTSIVGYVRNGGKIEEIPLWPRS